MFTVLIHEPDGNSRMREDAVGVRRIHTPIERDGKVVIDKGLLVRWSDGIETHYDEGQERVLYVMNRYGATVATHQLGLKAA